MLKILRNKKTAKKIWLGLAIIIVPAFILWGSGSLIRSKEESGPLGKIFGRKVTPSEFKDALNAVRNQAIMQLGDKFSEMQKYLNLETQAWERLVLLVEAKKRKIKVSDKEVIGLIQRYSFAQKKGRFDNYSYQQTLQYVFHTPPRVFEEQARQNLILAKLYDTVTSQVKVTDAEIKQAYRKENEQLSISYIAAIYADFEKETNPSAEEIKEYFQKNQLQFKQPLSFNIDYILLPSEDKDSETAKDKIEKIILRLNKKEGFAKVAADFGLSLKETGLFAQTDPIPGIGWAPEISNLISQAQTTQVLPPVQLDKNYYILRIKERKEPYLPNLGAIEDKVKAALIKEKSRVIAKKKIEIASKKLKEAIPSETDFDKLSKDLGLKSSSTDLFKYGSYIEGIGASDNFWLTARDLKEGQISPLITMPEGLYIIKTKSGVPVEEAKFSAEKTTFTQKFLSQKKEEYFLRFLEELKRKAII